MPLKHQYLIDVPFPIITPRLLIRPPQPGDGLAYNEAVVESIEHLAKYLPWADKKPTLDESENTARQHHVEYLKRESIALAIFDRNSQRLVGGSSLHNLNWEVRKFEIGYWVRASEEGKGLINEAVIAITRYAFDQLKANRVEIRCSSCNTRSKAIPERLGFHLDGCLRSDRYLLKTQVLADTLVFSRLDPRGLPELEITW